MKAHRIAVACVVALLWSVVALAQPPAPATGIKVDAPAADTTGPTVTITSPTSSPTHSVGEASTVAVGGTSSDAGRGVTSCSWVNSLGGSGSATGTTSWSVASIALTLGSNVITVTCVDLLGNIGTDVITVTRADQTGPTVTITGPTSSSTFDNGTGATITVSGTASDALSSVTGCSYTNSLGGSGSASGTTSWSISSLALTVGSNVITVTCLDSASNSGNDVITITRSSGGSDICSNEASSSTFYVSTTGSDSASGATQALAWLTVQKATATLTAGQTGCVAPGTYTASTAIQFANSGASTSNRITLKGFDGQALPVIDRQAVVNGSDTNCSNGLCAAFLIANRDWITLQRLDLRRGDGRNVIVSNGSDNFEFLDSISREVNTDDNSAGIFISPEGGAKPDEFYIARNTFHTRQLDTRQTTGSGIILFHSADGIIENNDFHDLYVGVYYKHSCENSSDVGACPPSDGVVRLRKNRFWNFGPANGGGGGAAIFWTHHDSFIENNLIYKVNSGQAANLGNAGIYIWDGGAGCSDTEANQNLVRWNTVHSFSTAYAVSRDSGCQNRQQGNQFINDIAFGFTSGGGEPGFGIWAFSSQGATDNSQTTISNSLAFSSTVAHDAAIVSTTYNLNALPASILGRTGNLITQPLFTDTANFDFRLTAASPGKNAASDGTDMGAYGNGVTCVGNPNASPTPPGC
jgi:hypothetical protein